MTKKGKAKPRVKQIDEDCWSAKWGDFMVEFAMDICGKPTIAVYPGAKKNRVHLDIKDITSSHFTIRENEGVVSFYTEADRDE